VARLPRVVPRAHVPPWRRCRAWRGGRGS
jgi:hypothetical protein